ncbi:MAG: hypothetical protein OXC30_02650 [Alphaproteobacteria bacterium]|nr:hypothetical protein [Alphaproteobacteria bacterium]
MTKLTNIISLRTSSLSPSVICVRRFLAHATLRSFFLLIALTVPLSMGGDRSARGDQGASAARSNGTESSHGTKHSRVRGRD